MTKRRRKKDRELSADTSAQESEGDLGSAEDKGGDTGDADAKDETEDSAAEDSDTKDSAAEDSDTKDSQTEASDTNAAAKADEPAPSQPPARSFKEWRSGAPLPDRAHLLLGLILPMLFVLASAWTVRAFTVDDAYISFRYAENLANGHGLVYNLGERVEGYTNFLWTVLLALFHRFGAPIEATAKVLGALSACAALVPTYLLSRRMRPFRAVPSLATWLLASSFLFTGYAVFGLETPLFIALCLGGTELFFREEDDETRKFPLSGVLFALASLTRPEAPLFFGLLIVWSDRPVFERKSLLRIAAFAAPVALHLLFRVSYYGAWVPTTLTAKTGDFTQQVRGGSEYIRNYLLHASPVLWVALGSAALSIVRRRRDGLSIASIAAVFLLYVVLVGGDWMPYFRFLAPVEPLLFLLIDDVLRGLFERRERAVTVGALAFSLVIGLMRVSALTSAQTNIIQNDKTFWDDAAGRTAEWFLKNAEPGPIAIMDIGYVGYRTKFPIVDMLGLLAPEIAALPGGYTWKVGEGYTDALFQRDPRYFLIIASAKDCKSPTKPGGRAVFGDPRFKSDFKLREAIALKGGAAWCIYEKKK